MELDSGQVHLSGATVIGISIAVAGNVLISLALNLQKLAHKHLDQRKELALKTQGKPGRNNAVEQESPLGRPQASRMETEPLLDQIQTGYDAARGRQSAFPAPLFSRSPRRPTTVPRDGHTVPELAVVIDVVPSTPPNGRKPSRSDETPHPDETAETEYLKSKLWWFGFLLMNVGELGNFISYAWAPASVVAPLGTFALIANCFFAPLILKERFRKRDLLGIFISIVGAVTVVLASNASDTRLDPDALRAAILQVPFLIYSGVYLVGVIILATLSEGRLGRQWVYIDVGLCALFGGFTVLSTKAVSTLLTMKWIDMFTDIITYPVLLVLIGTGVGQIRYLNRALMRFDSKIVIPVQFVLFNLSAIVGAAILYGDFKTATFHQIVTFLYGCGATFAGVFIITWSQTSVENQDEEEDQDDTPTASPAQPRSPQTPGTLGRRRGALILGDMHGSPILNHKQSAVSLMGISSARPLLLVHTPPREFPAPFDREDGRRSRESSTVRSRLMSTPSSK